MMQIKQLLRANSFIFLTILLVMGASFVLFQNEIIVSDSPSRLSAKYIHELLEESGFEETHKHIVGVSIEWKESERHDAGHSLGAAAFKRNVKSSDVFAKCRGELAFGCIHEFVGLQFAYNGIDSFDALYTHCLDQVSVRTFDGCAHGIGHGLIAFLGYTEEDLEKALDICNSQTHGDLKTGCRGGVFMEFNMRTMADGVLRTLPADEPHYPCGLLSSANDTCFFWIPQLWHQVFSVDSVDPGTHEAFVLLHDLCHSIDEETYKSECLEGIALISVPHLSPEEDAGITWCDSYQQEEESGSLACRWRLGQTFDRGDTAGRTADLMCKNLSGSKHARCEEYLRMRTEEFNLVAQSLGNTRTQQTY